MICPLAGAFHTGGLIKSLSAAYMCKREISISIFTMTLLAHKAQTAAVESKVLPQQVVIPSLTAKPDRGGSFDDDGRMTDSPMTGLASAALLGLGYGSDYGEPAYNGDGSDIYDSEITDQYLIAEVCRENAYTPADEFKRIQFGTARVSLSWTDVERKKIDWKNFTADRYYIDRQGYLTLADS